MFVIDLNPLDYSIWEQLKSDSSLHQYENLSQLEDAVEARVTEMSGDRPLLERIIRQFIPRCRAVLDADGGHIDTKDLRKFY